MSPRSPPVLPLAGIVRHAPAAAMPPPAVTLDYYADNGSLPPPHRRSTHATLAADGRLVVTRTSGYDGDGDASEHAVAHDDAAALVRDLRALGLFSTAWAEPERRTVGGGLRRLRVTAGEEHAEIPALVHADQRDAKRAILARVLAALPI